MHCKSSNFSGKYVNARIFLKKVKWIDLLRSFPPPMEKIQSSCSLHSTLGCAMSGVNIGRAFFHHLKMNRSVNGKYPKTLKLNVSSKDKQQLQLCIGSTHMFSFSLQFSLSTFHFAPYFRHHLLSSLLIFPSIFLSFHTFSLSLSFSHYLSFVNLRQYSQAEAL